MTSNILNTKTFYQAVAKERLSEARRTNPAAQLSQIYLQIAKEQGFRTWQAMKAAIEKQAAPCAIPQEFMEKMPPFLQNLLSDKKVRKIWINGRNKTLVEYENTTKIRLITQWPSEEEASDLYDRLQKLASDPANAAHRKSPDLVMNNDPKGNPQWAGLRWTGRLSLENNSQTHLFYFSPHQDATVPQDHQKIRALCEEIKEEIQSGTKESESEKICKNLRDLALSGCNIMIAGSTGSGKTTCLNRIMNLVPKNKRTSIVQYSNETIPTQINHINENTRFVDRKEDYFSLFSFLENTATPVIAVGETNYWMSSRDTLGFLNAMSSASSVISTIYAASAEDAEYRLKLTIKENTEDLPIPLQTKLINEMQKNLYIIHLKRGKNGEREFADFLCPDPT